MFTREVLVQQHGAVVRNIIASCRDSLVAYWKSTRTLPAATYLHTINVAAKKKVFHIFSVPGTTTTCPKFQHARTAAHNQVCKVIAASLQKHLAAHWSLHSETPLSKTGLILELVPAAIVLQSGRLVSDSDTTALQMSIGRWQTDFIAMSHPTKKLLSDQRCADRLIHVLKTCLRLIVKSYRHTNMFEQRFKLHCLRMDSPGPSMGRGHSETCA